MVGRIVFRCLMLTVVVEDLPVLSVLVLGLPTPSRLRKRPNRSKWTKGSEKEKRTVRKGLKNLRKRPERGANRSKRTRCSEKKGQTARKGLSKESVKRGLTVRKGLKNLRKKRELLERVGNLRRGANRSKGNARKMMNRSKGTKALEEEVRTAPKGL